MAAGCRIQRAHQIAGWVCVEGVQSRDDLSHAVEGFLGSRHHTLLLGRIVQHAVHSPRKRLPMCSGGLFIA